MAERALKDEALASLQAGRRELGAEAEWIRRKLNPKLAVTKVAREHTVGMLACAFVLGLGLPWIVFRSKTGHGKSDADAAHGHRRHSLDHGTTKIKKQQLKVGSGAYLAGLALNIAVPMLIRTGLKAWRHSLSAEKNEGATWS
jgi:hypothetical protein